MIVVNWVAWGLNVLINLYMLVLFARVIVDWVQFLRARMAPAWPLPWLWQTFSTP